MVSTILHDVVGAFLGYAGFAKLFAPQARAVVQAQLRELRPINTLSDRHVVALAMAEVVSAIAIIWGPAALGTLPAICVLLVLVVGAAALVAKGSTAPCMCFGNISQPLSWVHVAVTALVLVTALASFPLPMPHLPAAEQVGAALVAAGTAYILTRAQDVYTILAHR